MTTVASRTIRSNPYRDALETWNVIVEMLVQGRDSNNKRELLSVAGICASLIADQSPKKSPIVVTCDGPRTRIYCSFDEDAIDGSGENESPLGYDPLNGDWAISVPCTTEDLGWVTGALKKLSSRITARDINSGINTEDTENNSLKTLTLNPKGFLDYE